MYILRESEGLLESSNRDSLGAQEERRKVINEFSGIYWCLIWAVLIFTACPGPVGWGLGASWGLAILRSNVSLEEMEGCKLGKTSCFLFFFSLGNFGCFSGYTVSWDSTWHTWISLELVSELGPPSAKKGSAGGTKGKASERSAEELLSYSCWKETLWP